MDLSGLVPVRVRDCACPVPHEDGDVVYLLPALGLEGGAMAEFDLLNSQSIADEERRTFALLAKWTVTFVRYGAVAWNWTRLDEDGRPEPVPFDVEVLTTSYEISRLLAEKANELYSAAVMRPLLEAAKAAKAAKQDRPKPNRAQRRSQPGATGRSTSPRPAPTPKPLASSSPAGSDGPALRAVR